MVVKVEAPESKEDALDKEMALLPIVGAQPVDEREEKYLREVCDFEFYNVEEPGMSNSFPYGNSKKMMNFTLHHGQKCRVPVHVARHVESCATPKYAWRPDGKGSLVKTYMGINPRFQMRRVYK